MARPEGHLSGAKEEGGCTGCTDPCAEQKQADAFHLRTCVQSVPPGDHVKSKGADVDAREESTGESTEDRSG